MRKALTSAAIAVLVALGGAQASAAGFYDASQPPVRHTRSAYSLHNPEGPLNDYYRRSGLSDRREDCASYGCSVSNGG